jgi:hypothetical protein
MSKPEPEVPKPDGFKDLEDLHRRSKEEAVAWQKFLESLKNARTGPKGQPQKPTPENKTE